MGFSVPAWGLGRFEVSSGLGFRRGLELLELLQLLVHEAEDPFLVSVHASGG